MSGDVTKLNREFRLEQEQLRVNGTEKQKLASRVNYLSERYKMQQQEVQAVEQQLATAKDMFGENSKEVQQLENRLLEAQRKEAYFANELQLTSAELDLQNSKLHQLGESMQKIGGKMQDVGKSMTDIGKGMTMRLTVPIMGVATAASKLGIDFEKSMSEVAAVSGATGAELEQLEDAAREAGATTDKSARDAADALQYMALAGWDVETSQKALMPVLKLSSAANMDLGRTSDLVTDTMSALGLEIDDLDSYLDLLAQTSRNSNTDVDQLGEAFLNVGGKVKELKIPVEESAAALGIMADNGIKGSEAGKGLSAILTNLTAPTGRAEKALKELGISVFDSNGEFIGIEKSLKLVEDAMSGMTDEQKTTYSSMIAGKEHSKTLSALMGGLGGSFEELSKDIEGADGALEEMYDTATDNTMGALNNLQSAVEELGLKLFENLQPSIERVTELVQGFVDKMNELSPKQQEMVVRIGLIVAAIGPLLMIGGKIISGLGAVIGAIGTVSSAIAVMTTGAAAATPAVAGLATVFTVLTGPVGIAVAALTAVAGAGVYIANKLRKDAIPEVELFGDEVSETTAEAAGNFMDMTEEANVALKELSWGQQEVTSEMAEDMRTKQGDITETLMSAIDERNDQEKQKMMDQFEQTSALTEQEQAAAMEKLEQRFEDERETTEKGHERINQIIKNAEEEGREIRQDEADEILYIRESMNIQAVEMMSQNELEQKAILEQMRINSGTITALEAAEVVQNATEKKDAVIDEANQQYDETVAWAIEQRDVHGTLSAEEAARVIREAELQREGAVSEAEEMHESVVAEAKAQAGEHVDEVDWTTGEVLSKWDVMKNNVSTKLSEMGTNIRESWGNMSSTISTRAREMDTEVATKFSSMLGAISKNMLGSDSEVAQKAGSILRNIRSNFDQAYINTGNSFSAMRETMTNQVELARDAIGRAVERIKSFFKNMKLSIPSIKLPKLPKPKISGGFSLSPPRVPKISWNAKGGIFTKPTIFNTANAGLQGVGEAGPEAILPISKLAGMVNKVIEDREVANLAQAPGGQVIEILVPVKIDGREMAKVTSGPMSVELDRIYKRKRR